MTMQEQLAHNREKMIAKAALKEQEKLAASQKETPKKDLNTSSSSKKSKKETVIEQEKSVLMTQSTIERMETIKEDPEEDIRQSNMQKSNLA